MMATLALPQTSSIISESRQLLDGSDSLSEDDSDSDDGSLELTESPLRLSDFISLNKEEKQDNQNRTLKDELRNKIQGRRRSEGVGELKVSFEPPSTYNLTPDEKRKSDARRQRNRDSANRSRLKRKFQLEYLEKEAEDLTTVQNRLVSDVKALKEVKDTLEKKLQSHKCNNPKLIHQRTANQASCSQTSHTRPPNITINAEDFNRGRLAFQMLSPEKQNAFLLAFGKRRDSVPGASSSS